MKDAEFPFCDCILLVAEFVLGKSISDFSTCMLKSHEITGFPQNMVKTMVGMPLMFGYINFSSSLVLLVNCLTLICFNRIWLFWE